MREIATDDLYRDEPSQGSLSTWTAVAVWPNTDTIWMETRMEHSSQWAELRAVRPVITHEPLLLILCIDSWAGLKGLTAVFEQWEDEG